MKVRNKKQLVEILEKNKGSMQNVQCNGKTISYTKKIKGLNKVMGLIWYAIKGCFICNLDSLRLAKKGKKKVVLNCDKVQSEEIAKILNAKDFEDLNEIDRSKDLKKLFEKASSLISINSSPENQFRGVQIYEAILADLETHPEKKSQLLQDHLGTIHIMLRIQYNLGIPGFLSRDLQKVAQHEAALRTQLYHELNLR